VLQHFDGLKVDVHNPEVDLRVEVRHQESFVYSESVPGPGGFPLGSNGRAMLMLSGGIDSPVAGWFAMKRGLRVEAVHFHSYPYTSERAKQKVIDLTRVLADYAGSIHLHLVPFTDIQTRLKESCRENLIITLMRRAMYRITEQLADKREALAIVTGESLGQVASQTLANMNVIGRVATLPVIRPLVTMDKLEIIPIAEKINTFPISILPYEDCCTLFVPKSPSTNPSLKVVERQEQWMEEWLPEAIRAAVAGTETMLIKPDDKSEEDRLF
jgi:thiamine biosynthesis protein ThiI